MDARWSTFPWDQDNHGYILASQGFVYTPGGEIRCAFCQVYYGNWFDKDRHLHVQHHAICAVPWQTFPAAIGPGSQVGALGPHFRFRVRPRGVQDSGQGPTQLCVGWLRNLNFPVCRIDAGMFYLRWLSRFGSVGLSCFTIVQGNCLFKVTGQETCKETCSSSRRQW